MYISNDNGFRPSVVATVDVGISSRAASWVTYTLDIDPYSEGSDNARTI